MKRLEILFVGGLLLLFSAVLVFATETNSGTSAESMDGRLIGLSPSVTDDEVEDEWFEKLDIAVAASGVVQGRAGETAMVDGTARYELELQFKTGSADLMHFHMEAGNGTGMDQRFPVFSSLNCDASGDSENPSITEAWYLHRFGFLNAVLEVGKISLGGPGDNAPNDAVLFDANEFANNERSQFLSSAFVNSEVLKLPDNGPAGVFRFAPVGFAEVSIGIADADAGWSNLLNGIFSIVEVNFKPVFVEHEGNYRIYGWLNDICHGDGNDSAVDGESDYGFGVSSDQEVSDYLGIFTRYGWRSHGVTAAEAAWSAGLQLSGLLPGREGDVLGAAFGMTLIGDDWRVLALADGILPGDEGHLEVYYNFELTEHLNISPDFQMVVNPGGNKNEGCVDVFGFRAQLIF